jgi:predicted  nucleic acid-binding Zn-ribbon protein
MKLQSQRTNFEVEIRQLENEIYDTEQKIRRGDADYNAMSDYQKGRWQSDKRSLESTLESLKRERNRKTAPDTSIEETRLNALKSSLGEEKVLMSGNFWILEI